MHPGAKQREVGANMAAMRLGSNPKQVYIFDWTRECVTGKFYLRAVYALGNKPDAKKPAKLTNAERCARWKAKQKLGRTVPNSIFNLAQQHAARIS